VDVSEWLYAASEVTYLRTYFISLISAYLLKQHTVKFSS